MSLVGLGSVSDAVLRKAPVPVLLVRWDPSHPMAHVTEATPSPTGPVRQENTHMHTHSHTHTDIHEYAHIHTHIMKSLDILPRSPV